MSTTWSPTAGKVITYAMRATGRLAEGDTPDTDQYTEGVDLLNGVLLQLQTRTIPLWTIELRTKTFTAPDLPVEKFTVGTDVLGVKSASLIKDSSSLPLDIIDVDAYSIDDGRLVSGISTKMYFDRPVTSAPYVYLLPKLDDADYALQYWVMRRLSDVSVNTIPDLPAEWFLTLVYLTASIMADLNHLALPERQYIENKGRGFLESVKIANKPRTTKNIVKVHGGTI